MEWLIAAFIVPVPVIHLWLHSLLPWWRKRPLIFYAWAVLLWLTSFLAFKVIAVKSYANVFETTTNLRSLGWGLVISGAVLAVWSFVTLGPRRFLVWSALHPHEKVKFETAGPFRFFPHPAYFGYLAVALGNLLIAGQQYLLLVFMFLIVVTPLAIGAEDKELKKRFGK